MATNTSAEIQAQMQKVAAARQAALDAEKERLAHEQAFQKAEREATAELQRLQQQHAETVFSEAQAESDVLVKQGDAHIDATLFPALDAIEAAAKAAAPHLKRVEELFQQHLTKRDEAMSGLNPLFFVLPGEAASAHHSSDDNTVLRNGSIIRQHALRITPALSPGFALMDWICRSRDGEQYQRRIGIVYALHGQLYDSTDRNNPPTREQLREQLRKQFLQR